MKNFFAVASSDLPELIKSSLNERFRCVFLPPDEAIDVPVRSHPDMILAAVGENIVFPQLYAERNPEIVNEIVSLSGMNVILSRSGRGRNYPDDVSLNCAVVGDLLVCRKKSTAVEVLESAQNSGLTIVNTNQGYAGCSTFVLGYSVVTSDSGIYGALTKCETDCALVTTDGITLEGYDCGFIGGCGGFLPDYSNGDSGSGTIGGTAYFFGSLESYCDRTVITEFAKKYKVRLEFLSNLPLCDYGGIKFFEIK